MAYGRWLMAYRGSETENIRHQAIKRSEPYAIGKQQSELNYD